VTDVLKQLQDHFAGELSVERELGGGGMSQVVLALDTRLNRRVVIKLLPPHVTATISSDRFEREIMLSAALQHPNIVPVLSAGKVNGLPYFIMPFIEGESLRARMMRGPLSARETVNILKDVCRALAFAHGRGVIHRDIKPDNILLSAGARAAVVTDFGVAKALSASRHSGDKPTLRTVTGVGMSPGTPAYMAPEQAAADPNTDHRADIYALGIVAYEMLAGTPPFHGRSPQALLAAQMSETPPALWSRRYDVPKPLADLVMQSLEKDPRRRPESAASVLRTLEDPSIVSDVFAAPPAARKRSTRKAIMAGVTLLLMIAAALWVTRWLRSQSGVAPTATLSTSSAAPRSIAVLPLTSIGNDERARAAGDGIASELVNAVARVEGFRVASLTESRAAFDSARGIAALGRALGVVYLLEGTVQRERDRLRVMMRLVRVANDSTMWAETFQGSADSAFVLQDAIARSVAAAAVRVPR
jgi:eukaryotic-like serine/threonine-protein kinase